MTPPVLRWGILGTATIARKNWQAIRHTGNGVITAVASRDPARAHQFIAECQREAPFASAPRPATYEELLGADDVDAVYIPLPTGIRKEWVIRAAQAGKHIVCEKPCAVSVADLREMLDACRRHRVQFMDGVMFLHSRRLGHIRQVLDDGETIGPIRRIGSVFHFSAPEEFFTANIRARGGLEPLGCLGDLGWYNIRFALWVMRGQMPRGVTGRILSAVRDPTSPAPVPTEFSGELFFDGGVSAGFYCSFITEYQQWANIAGVHGYLHVHDFVLPVRGPEVAFATGRPELNFEGCQSDVDEHTRRWTVAEHGNNHPTAQETNLFRNFAAQVQSGALNEDWPQMALKTQQVLEACLQSTNAASRLVELGA